MYVDVPEDMVGGALELWRYGSWKDTLRMKRTSPDYTATPSNNTMVAFRGDSYHQVKAYHSATSKAARLSLVLEQYKIGHRRHVSDTLEWVEEAKES